MAEYTFDSVTVTADLGDVPSGEIESFDDVVERYDSLRDRLHERCVAGFLDANNGVLGEKVIGKGSRTHCVIDVQELVRVAALTNASGVVLVHNHPSENTKPTESDRKMTKQVAMALEIINVPLFDHVILSREDSYSMRKNDESEMLKFLWGDPENRNV